MNLSITRTKSATSLYVAQSVREGKVVHRKIIEKLGTTTAIMSKYGLASEEEAINWAKQYISKMNDEKRTEQAEIKIAVHPNRVLNLQSDSRVQLGYLVLQKLYHTLGLNLICDTIKKKYKIKYDLDHIVQSLIYARIIDPASKLRTSEDVSRYYKWSSLQPHQVYRSLSLLAKESDYIQSQLFLNSQKVMDRDTTILYFDCSNFYCETEQSSGYRQYGVSKEHRPNPIVEFGLFMDTNGYPLAFCVDKGNTSETKMMIPLEEKIINKWKVDDFIVCTDAAMAIAENKKFNTKGERHFVTSQPIKKISDTYQEWALNPDGWRKYIQFRDEDTDEEQKEKQVEKENARTYNINEIDESAEYNTIFYKKIGFNQNIRENGVNIAIEQTLYVTYSVKYKEYQRNIRKEQIEHAQKYLQNKRDPGARNSRDYKRFISKEHCTDEGEVAQNQILSLNNELIENEEKFDGFYGISADRELGINIVFSVLHNKWEIEESFRIMKTDFRTRPIFLSRDDRIKAHIMTCFLSLFVYRMLEKKYMRERYTSNEIITALRDLDAVKVGNSDGLITAFKYSYCMQSMLITTHVPLNYEYLSQQKLDQIVKLGKSNPERVKRLFEPNKRHVGRPSTAEKAKEAEQDKKKKSQKANQ